MSIHPKYANAINNGVKTIEVRKKFSVSKLTKEYPHMVIASTIGSSYRFSEPVAKIYIYSTSPEKEIIGYFITDNILVRRTDSLWEHFNRSMMIEKEDYDNYCHGREFIYGIQVRSGVNFTKNRPSMKFLKENGISIPQSYQFLTDEQVKLIDGVGI